MHSSKFKTIVTHAFYCIDYGSVLNRAKNVHFDNHCAVSAVNIEVFQRALQRSDKKQEC